MARLSSSARHALRTLVIRHRRQQSILPRQDVPDTIQKSKLSIASFREHYFLPGQPLVVEFDHPDQFPALENWFSSDAELVAPACRSAPAHRSRLHMFQQTHVPYELLYDPEDDTFHRFLSWLTQSREETHSLMADRLRAALPRPDDHVQYPTMLHFSAELSLLLLALEFNNISRRPLTGLYIAQASIADLPDGLARDVPTPDLVLKAGKADIYGSSIWLGLEPTYTSFHRDPNPNLLCQLCGHKAVRMLPPESGERLFRQVQAGLGRQGNPRIRGAEMMDGPERAAFYDALWKEQPPGTLEAKLQPGEGLFIPLGWWHTVTSRLSTDGSLNGSVNWWFR